MRNMIQDDKEILSLYSSGLGSTKISRIIGISKNKIIYRLKQNNVILEGPKRNKIEIDEKHVIKYYLDGSAILKISEKFNVSGTTILNILKKNNIKRRKCGPKRSISINDCSFKSFNIHNCYWAGFIAADGCVYKNQTSLHLHSCDLNHLHKFKNFLNLSSPVLKNKSQESHYISFRSNQIVDDLKNNFNIISNKSLILQPPIRIPIEFIRHYVRGYFDGDGCLSKSGKYLNFEIYSGSINLLNWMKHIIIVHNRLNSNIIVHNKKGNCFRFSFCGLRPYKIMDWLYKDSEDYLERKYIKYKGFLEEQ